MDKSLEQWIKDEAEGYLDELQRDKPFLTRSRESHFRDAYEQGMVDMHIHLSESHEKEIAEEKERFEGLRLSRNEYMEAFEKQNQVIYDLKNERDNFKSLTEQHQQEIERLKGLLKDEFMRGLRGFGYDVQREKMWSEFAEREKLNIEPNVQASVATESDSSNTDGT